jgi:hypothetical protein
MEVKIVLLILALIGFFVAMFHAVRRDETLMRNKELEARVEELEEGLAKEEYNMK